MPSPVPCTSRNAGFETAPSISSVTFAITTYTRWFDHPWQWPQWPHPSGLILDPAAFAVIAVIVASIIYYVWFQQNPDQF